MLTVVLFGILVGLDNLQFSSALGVAGMNKSRRWLLVASFAFFEMTMPLLGLLIGKRINATWESAAMWIGPGIMVVLGLYMVIQELREGESESIRLVDNRWASLLLPLSMSLDNLFAGLGLGASGYPVVMTAVVVGLCAGGMCMLGLWIGARVRRFIPRRVELFSGFYMIGMSIMVAAREFMEL